MTIDVYSICYNESKFINLFLTHYAQFVNNIIIYDNYSTDDTCNKILKFDKCATQIIKYDTKNQIRDDIYLEIKNNCWKNSSADFVIVCDLDELLYHPQLLSFLKNTDYNLFKPVGYNMVSDFFPSDDIQVTEQIKTGALDKWSNKCVLFKPNETHEINYQMGCHSCNPISKTNLKLYDSTQNNSQLKLLHYKNLTFKYRFEKHNAYQVRLSEFNKQNCFGYHYSENYDIQYNEYLALLKNSSVVI